MTSPVTTPYSSVAPLFPAAGGAAWVPDEEKQRILSYQVYEDIYWTNPNTFVLQTRGSNSMPIYVPSGRIIVDTFNRYLAKNFNFVADADPALGSDAEKLLAAQSFKALFNRERFFSKFSAAKRFGIMKGDWCFHITADPSKPAGRRLAINALDPAQYFPIHDSDNVDRVVAVDLVEEVTEGDNTYLKRLRYSRDVDNPASTTIFREELLVEADEDWDSDRPKVVRVLLPEEALPPAITAFPVYHIKNFEEPQNPYGSSEMRGLERIIAAANQAISDEELVLALEGIGTYFTDAGQPEDDAGNPVPWQLGPGRVIEGPPGSSFARVNGVNTLGPFQEHLKYIHEQMDEASGTPAVAKGKVEVLVAESGIALKLRYAPILDKAEEKDLLIKDVMRQMAFDLKAWMSAYESINLGEVVMEPEFGEKLPKDSNKRFDQIMQMWSSGLVSDAWARDALREIGWTIPTGMGQEILDEAIQKQAYAEANDLDVLVDPDAAGERMAIEATRAAETE